MSSYVCFQVTLLRKTIAASFILANKRFFSGVDPNMNLQSLRSMILFVTVRVRTRLQFILFMSDFMVFQMSFAYESFRASSKWAREWLHLSMYLLMIKQLLNFIKCFSTLGKITFESFSSDVILDDWKGFTFGNLFDCNQVWLIQVWKSVLVFIYERNLNALSCILVQISKVLRLKLLIKELKLRFFAQQKAFIYQMRELKLRSSERIKVDYTLKF